MVKDGCSARQTKLRIEILKRYYLNAHAQVGGNVIDLANKITSKEQEISIIFDKVLKDYDKLISENNGEDKQGFILTKQKIVNAQKLWIRYRDLNCASVYNLHGSKQVENECRYYMDCERLKDLQHDYYIDE